MANIIVFAILAAVIIVAALASVFTTRIMRAVTALLFVLFAIAGIYFLLDYTFLGAAQISIYAGGITIMYIFAIQLLSKRTLQGMVERVKGSRIWQGAFIAVAGAVTVITIFVKNNFIENYASNGEVPIEKIGTQLLSSGVDGYVLPFEFISLFLLACIIGGTLIGKKGDDE